MSGISGSSGPTSSSVIGGGFSTRLPSGGTVGGEGGTSGGGCGGFGGAGRCRMNGARVSVKGEGVVVNTAANGSGVVGIRGGILIGSVTVAGAGAAPTGIGIETENGGATMVPVCDLGLRPGGGAGPWSNTVGSAVVGPGKGAGVVL